MTKNRLNYKPLLKTAFLSGLLMLSQNISGRDFEEDIIRTKPTLDRIIATEYNQDQYEKFNEKYSFSQYKINTDKNLKNINLNLKTQNIQKIEWLLDIYNNPLSENDLLTIIETSFEGINYPYAIEIDYSAPEKKDLLLLSSLDDLGYSIKINYFEPNGDLRRTLWTNKKNESLFDIESYDFYFPLAGSFNNYSSQISSLFGERTNPVKGIYGGPDKKDHKGIDIPCDIGTEIFSPYKGMMSAGYVAKEDKTDEYNTFLSLGKISEIYSSRIYRNANRRSERQRITFQFFHLSNYPEIIKEQYSKEKAEFFEIPQKEFKKYTDWYNRLLSEQDEKKLFNELQKFNMNSYYFNGINVKQNQIIGYTGNTGLSTGPHIHIGVLINGKFVNPVDFFRKNGIRKYDNQTIVFTQYLEYNKIKNYFSSK